MGVATPQRSPYVWTADDYLQRQIIIEVFFDEATGALGLARVSRDNGCAYTKIVLDTPSSAKAKRFAAPKDGVDPVELTGAQLARAGVATIDDVLSVQITAEP